MLITLRWFCCVALLLGSAASAVAQSAAVPASTRTVRPGVLVFRLKASPADASQPRRPGPAVLPAALTTALSSFGATARPKFPRAAAPTAARAQAGAVDLGLLYELRLPAGTSPEQLRQRLLKTGLVEYAEPLYNYQHLQQPNDPQADSAGTGGQYYLRNIRAHQAWGITQGDTSVVIGIIDGGTRFSHEDLTNQNQLNRRDPIDGIDNDGDGYVDNYYGWDFADNDNDPERLRNPTDLTHGVLVTGIAAAATNNGRGIAGVGYKSRYLPLKIYPSTPEGSFGGYEAIVYAADHGCRVINLSWGGTGAPSRFEQDVINYAVLNHDVVVVAAAGNTPQDLDFYPASYQHVVSVASTARTDERSVAATFSYRVDVSAPGEGIFTTLGVTDTDYAQVGGSSFAAPQVAGAAALVRARFPSYNAAQVAAQLRRTTDFIDNLPGNVAYAGRLGSGRLNVFRAVSEQPYSARVVARMAAPARSYYAPADTLRLIVRVQNLLRELPGLTVTLTSLSPYLLVRQGEFAAGPLATLAEVDNAATPFRLAVAAAGVPLNTKAVLRYRLHHAASGYTEYQYETLLLNPDYVVLDANNLHLTLTSRGNLGYDGTNPSIGEGISYRQGPPLLAEGGLLLATSATRLASNVRNDNRGNDADFIAVAQVRRLPSASGAANQRAEGRMREAQLPAANPQAVGVALRQRATARTATPHQSYVLLEYQLTNLTADTLRPLHLGLFMDWDLPDDPAHNVAGWDAARRLGYAYNAPNQTIYAGVQHLAGGQPSVFSLDTSPAATGPVRLSDGFSRAEKWLTLSSSTTNASAGLPAGTDAAQVVGAVLPYLAPADSVMVAFAVLAAPSLAELQAAADAATAGYQQVPTATKAGILAGVRLYPNPTAGRVRLELPAGPATVRVLSVLGQQLAAYNFQQPTASLDLSAYPAGLYLIRVQTTAGAATYRILKRP
ncbi:S8 family peptidase [Hymenobacter psychrophilus]|uniref:Por secretion system C-terminal sorting domain-containing protein n=1 Tax=Hymenobacter psychrophilus TaxID=651662 RepID=A0A1H3IWW4_9BACT|nr:S8 family peptidase [Hymenobacter psychrophilus]SDY32142.1 Por secretion system C-terminal sorting domain-containing protein [Hymenobacter psychrophilus]